ncbi:MAG: hypothetical protein RRX92_09345 [Lachnospiraceae bacterium]
MYEYSMIEWIMFFYIYCFLGWCIESAYVSCCSHKLVNRGFMRGPFLPLYGSGALVMLIVSMPFQDNLLLTYIAGVIGATVLEYVTGVLMETLFKVRYWDYSVQPLNYKGYICAGSSLAWGFLTILMTHVIHEPIAHMVLLIPQTVLTIVVFILTVLIVADFSVAFRTALDLRDILVHMDKAKQELERMQKRLDVIAAVIDDTKEEIAEGIDQKLSRLKDIIQEKPTGYAESIRDEIAEIRTRFSIQAENKRQLKVAKDFNRRNLILGNPSMRSAKYNEMLNELKEEIELRRKERHHK